MVWSFFSGDGADNLYVIGNQDDPQQEIIETLNEEFLPAAAKRFGFQMSRALYPFPKPHKVPIFIDSREGKFSRTLHSWNKDFDIRKIPFDCSPFSHLWSMLNFQMKPREIPTDNAHFSEIIWSTFVEKIPSSYFSNLISCMLRNELEMSWL